MPSIVVLNGPSSAGKTTLAHTLRDRIGASCTALSIDAFFAFKHRDATPTWAVYDTLTAALFASAAAFADGGFDVVVDTVFERPASLDTARRMLAHRPFSLVAVTAPLAVLEAREQGRGDRRAGQARDQHERVLAGIAHDLVLDTHALSVDACVEAILSDSRSLRDPVLHQDRWSGRGSIG